jgi:hypothetical protein
MFKLLHNVYTLLSFSGRYASNHRSIYIKTNHNVQPMCCNAFRNLEKIKGNEKYEDSFMCEMTNKPKRKGTEDCKCEKICILKKSETQLIYDSSKKNN